MLTDVDWKNTRLPMSCIACSLPGQPKWARAFSWPFRASRVSLSLSLCLCWPLVVSHCSWPLAPHRGLTWPRLASLGLSRPHVASPGIAWPLVASRGLSWPQDGPRSPQDGPTMVPRRLKMASKVATMAPRWPHETWPERPPKMIAESILATGDGNNYAPPDFRARELQSVHTLLYPPAPNS